MHLSTFYRLSDAILLICLIAGVKYQHKDTQCNFRLNGSLIPEPALLQILCSAELSMKKVL